MDKSLAVVRDTTRAGVPLLAFNARGSIAPRIQGPVVLVAAYATVVWLAHCAGVLPSLGNGTSSLVGVISGVTGLLVAFRSSSSSDRWHEGRRLWANVTSTSRTLLRTLALALPPPHSDDTSQLQLANETLALIPAFAYALKDHLRDQSAIADRDVKDLLAPAFLSHLSSSSTRAKSPRLPAQEVPDNLPKQDVSRELANLNNASPAGLAARATPRHRSTNAPLAIIGQLHAQLNAFHTVRVPSVNSPQGGSEALDTPTWANCLGLLQNLTEQVTHMERIKDTPIPMSLAIHLQQLIGLYVLAVPLQLVGSIGFLVIPISAVTAFVYYGIDSISQELSDPFGTEPNDLPLDKFCADLRREYREVIGQEEEASLAGLDAASNAANRLKRD